MFGDNPHTLFYMRFIRLINIHFYQPVAPSPALCVNINHSLALVELNMYDHLLSICFKAAIIKKC